MAPGPPVAPGAAAPPASSEPAGNPRDALAYSYTRTMGCVGSFHILRLGTRRASGAPRRRLTQNI